MAVPVIVGLGWLGSLLFGAFTGAVAFLAQYLTKKFAITLVIITVFISITAALVLGIESLVSTISVAVPSSLFTLAGLFIPSNYSTCIGVALSVRLLRWVYDQNVKILEFKAQS